jgi:xanthine dehydrogenase accessory factor
MQIYSDLAALLDHGERVVLVTVIRTRGSTPREVGAQMLIKADGSTLGTIGGGCGEADVWSEAMEAFADGRPRLVEVDLLHDHDLEGGRACGGIMSVFVEPVL